jgi:hypothetical protein
MGIVHHGQETLRRDEQFRPSERLPEHGVLAKQDAVLLGAINAEVVPSKVPQSLALATSEDNPPQGCLWLCQCDSSLLLALWQHATSMAWEEGTLGYRGNML